MNEFRNLNKQIKIKPYPMTKINEILFKVWGVVYAMSLSLNMGYYHIWINRDAINLCMVIGPWGKYCYKLIPMKVNNSPEHFQQKMNDLFQIFDFIR